MADKQAFVQSIYDAGIAAGLTDAAARVMAGQAALESAYGEDPDAARTLNFFGIKGGNEWTGPVDVRPTIEGSGKNAKTVDQAFRVYSTVEQGIADRVAFMDLHFPAFSQSKTVGDAFDSLQHGAYGPHGNDGQYFTADRATYEGAVNKVNVTYLKGTPTPPQGIPNIVDVSKGGTAGKALILANNLPLKPRTEPITGVVFHHTGGTSLAGAVNGSQVEGSKQHGKGATYYIDTDGSIYQYADVEKVMNGIRSPSDAYRTDKGKPTDKLSNNSTISIEVVGLDSGSFTPAQKAAAASLGAYLAKQYNIAPSMIVGHGDLQGGPGGNKQPTEGVELAAYVRDALGNPAVDAINQAVPGIGTLGHRGAEPQGRMSGAFADVRDPPNKSQFDSRLSDLDVIRTSAAYGIRRPPAAAPAKIPAADEFVSLDDVFTAEQFMPDGGRDYSKLSGANRGFDPVGPGPSSWFTSGKDAAPYFGAKETGRSSQVISVAPITSAAGAAGAGAGAAGAAALNAPVPPTPMPGRPAGLDAVAPKPAEPAAAPAAVAEAPAKQTVRVGKHNYEVGATFDQGGFHYTVTPDGIQKSRIPTGEKTLVGGIIGQVVKEKLKEAVPEVTAQVGTTAAAALEATKQKGAALVEQAQKIGSTFSGLGGAFSGLFGGGGTPAPATDRLAEVIHKGYAGGVASLGPVDLGVEFDKRVTITPYPPAQIQLVAPKFAGGVKEIAFANLNVPGAPKPVERETQVVEHKIVPVKTSMSTVEPPKGSIARVGSDQKIEHVGATSVKTVPTAKPTYKSVTSPNPAYEAWVSKQTRSTGGDVKEEHGKAIQVRSSTVDAASAGPPPPKTVTKQVVVDTPAPIKKSTSVAQPQTSITTTTTTRAAEVTQATRAAAVANDNASGWVSGGNDGTRGPTQTVELASGKVAAVGAIGTAQDGRYVFQVQEDGSVKNLTTGRTSAPATSRK